MLPMRASGALTGPRPRGLQKMAMESILRSCARPVPVTIEESPTADLPDESNGLLVAFGDWAPPMPRVYIIDTIEKLARCLQLLRSVRLAYIAAKGHFCSRKGSMSILQVRLETTDVSSSTSSSSPNQKFDWLPN